MKRTLSHSVRLISLFFVLAGISTGQVSLGTPAFGSFGGGPFDTVNLGNLNVNFKIPIRHKAGRGTPFSYDLTYDNSVWNPVLVNNQLKWMPVNTGAFYWGWLGLSATQRPVNLSYSTTPFSSTCGQNQQPYSQWNYFNFVYTDENGTSHSFPNSNAYIQSPGPPNCPPNGPEPPTTVGWAASDGSGLTLYATPGPGTMSSYVTTRSGTTFNGVGFAGSNDPNGNQTTLSGGVYTDTLGQTALTVAGAPPSNTTLSYTAPSGATAIYTVSYVSYTIITNFACSGVGEYNVANIYLVDKITLPDSSFYQFKYEQTPGDNNTNHVTARLASVTLPTGGSITYAYQGSNDGIVCADGSTLGLQRTLSPGGTWTYTRTGSGSQWQTAVLTPVDGSANDNIVLQFQKDSATPVSPATMNTNNFYETQRQTYQGAISSSNLLKTTVACYNNNTSNCTTTPVASPITQRTVTLQYPNGGQQSQTATTYSGGLPTVINQYAYGPSAPGALIQNTQIAYASLGAILDHPSLISVYDGSSHLTSQTSYTYDEYSTYPLQPTTGTPNHGGPISNRGNATTVTNYTSSSGGLTRHFSYYDTGNVYQSYDVNLAVTTYVYGTASQGNSTISCGNSFPTSVNLPVNSLSTSTAWDCNGAVATKRTDVDLQSTNITYNEAFYWRPASSQDPASNTTTFAYTTTSAESSLAFNGNASVAEQLATVDGLGRVILNQRQQGYHATNYDSTQTSYDTFGRASQVTMPYVGIAGQTTSSAPTTTTVYDALNRPTKTTDAGGGYVAYTYTQNDVLQTKGPAPTGENSKKKQLEYDALGRLISVCEVTQGTGYVPCAQSTSYNGYMSTYVYDVSGGYNRVTVTQNAQSTPTQTRVYLYDLLGRLVSETNPETNNAATTYAFDSASGCSGTYNGDLVKRVDAKGNTTCYTYDAMHRVISATYSGPYATPTKNFVYDSATVNGVAMANAKGHLAEAYTGSSGAKVTDIGFVYSVRGEVTEIWESTPHSGGYYHPTAAYWANGKLNNLWMSGLPSISYGADSEGRMSTVSASSGQNPVTGVTYIMSGTTQPIGSLTQVTYGSGDSDNFTYDTNTGRMTQFKYTVSTNSEIGNLGWNANGSLASLSITDPFNSSDAQNCTYSHDDLARIATASCGSIWGQIFNYDVFGNITKSVPTGSTGVSWQPTYTHGTTNTNQYFSLPGFTPTYDANGNLLTDSFHTYTWDAEGKMLSLDSTTLTYDALGRMVEQNQSGTYFQIVYSPQGKKLAIMKAQVIQQAFVPLPGKTKAEYLSWGLSHYRHPDWLGSSRLESSTTHAIIQSVAYDPYGVPYAQLSGGNGELSFTGQNKDTAWLNYDFIDRQYDPTQGRWLSPDRAGLAAVDPASPQSWNRYAYVMNNPLALVDPFGDDCYGAAGENDFQCAQNGGTWVDIPQTVTVTPQPTDPAPTVPTSPPDQVTVTVGNPTSDGRANGASPGSSSQTANNAPPPVPKPPNPIENPSTKDKICFYATAAVSYFTIATGPGALSATSIPSIITGGAATAGEVGGFVIAPEVAVPVLTVGVTGALLLCM